VEKHLEPKLAPNNGNNPDCPVRKSPFPLISTSDETQKVTAVHLSETAVWRNNSCGLNKRQSVLALIMMITGVMVLAWMSNTVVDKTVDAGAIPRPEILSLVYKRLYEFAFISDESDGRCQTVSNVRMMCV
jgi:hypothetical protein